MLTDKIFGPGKPRVFRFIFRLVTATGWSRYVEVQARDAGTAETRLEQYARPQNLTVITLCDVLELDAVPRWAVHASL